MNNLVPVHTDRFTHARRQFFESGQIQGGVLGHEVVASWRRCASNGRTADEKIEFARVTHKDYQRILEQSRVLRQVAQCDLEQLAGAVAGAGYVTMLTDARGYAISIAGPVERHSSTIRNAFRVGVDASEEAIGTSAMSVAMKEARPVRVFAGEHFFTANHQFHCLAAPVFDPNGQVVGAIDITRDSTGESIAALPLVQSCARKIERRMVDQLDAFLVLRLTWDATASSDESSCFAAFDADGRTIALNRLARRLLTGGDAALGSNFSDLFEGNFGAVVSALRQDGEPLSIESRNGLLLSAQAQRQASARARPVAVSVRHDDTLRPQFADARVDQCMQQSLRSLRAGLPVLLQGESGSGKEVVARALHAQSARCDGPFVAINCAAIPAGLIESELFGYGDGAFTGARRQGAMGKIEAADGGTLFLDEIGDMPLALQTVFLRVLDRREVTRLGGLKPVPVNIQLIGATHRSLAGLVASGAFRNDLYYRINGFQFDIPPLRERSDFDAIVQSHLRQLGGEGVSLSPEARQLFRRYRWPGNIRELRHAMTYAHAMLEPGVGVIGPALLPQYLQPGRQNTGTENTGAESAAAPAARGTQGSLHSLTVQAMREALQMERGNISAAARRLGVSRATLYRRTKDLPPG